MCLVVLVAIVGTAYLAVFFNRRAKADLQAALAPLAEVIDGEIDLEEAEVIGRFASDHVKARMANASEGPGRVWQVDVLDAAGGVSWEYTSSLPRGEETEPRIQFESPQSAIRDRIPSLQPHRIRDLIDPGHVRFRLEYSPDSGFVRHIVPMVNRRDIPDADRFRAQLNWLVALASENRAVQESLKEELG
jgi:hypothetical protein